MGRKAIHEALGSRDDKPFKATLGEGDHLFLGLNVLLPGQEQPRHDHPDQDKFYLVHEGKGHFEVGEERFEAGPGDVIWAAAGVPHGVRNESDERLIVLVGMGPPPPRRG